MDFKFKKMQFFFNSEVISSYNFLSIDNNLIADADHLTKLHNPKMNTISFEETNSFPQQCNEFYWVVKLDSTCMMSMSRNI